MSVKNPNTADEPIEVTQPSACPIAFKFSIVESLNSPANVPKAAPITFLSSSVSSLNFKKSSFKDLPAFERASSSGFSQGKASPSALMRILTLSSNPS